MAITMFSGKDQSASFFQGKGKEDYITGNAKNRRRRIQPTRNGNLKQLGNVLTASSMTHETGENFMYYGTAVEIWNAAKETYSNVDNTSAIFEIRVFYTTCDKEIPLLLNTTTLSQVEKDRISILVGVNRNLDEVRGRILGTKPLPSIREAFAEVRREESRRKIMLGG
ncbi:hypothetical protein SESBI_32635 [Sesbania bispinosa]|nr:hypothetical protein SESBI_32635 [Sesbania bispinosa]